MTLFANKYRIESARLKGWDYASNGAYFVTICTKNRVHSFGNIRDCKMLFSEIGKIANDCWAEIPNHFTSVFLGEWIIMPDHLHGILFIFSNDGTIPIVKTPIVDSSIVETSILKTMIVETPKLGVSTTTTVNTTTTTTNPTTTPSSILTPTRTAKNNITKNTNWKSGNLGVIINQYKRACTIKIRKILPDFSWQPRFHDHIIRSGDELHRIEKYIIENPANWLTDDLHV